MMLSGGALIVCCALCFAAGQMVILLILWLGDAFLRNAGGRTDETPSASLCSSSPKR